MSFYTLKLNFFFILMALALINVLTAEKYYAPVNTNSKGFIEDRQIPIINEQGLSSGYGYQRQALLNQESQPYFITVGSNTKLPDTESENKVAGKKKQNTRAKNVSTLPQKTINSVSDKTRHGNKKQQTQLDVTKHAKRKHKPAVSIDNSKKSELSFGWPMKGRVLKSFSPSHNKGIDIAGKKGQPVKATEAGKVVYGGQGLIGFGKLLIIRHNDVYLSAYANNSRLLVNEGQDVQKGQIIAEVGDVGIRRTSLHFEIRKNGLPVNPIKLLPKK